MRFRASGWVEMAWRGYRGKAYAVKAVLGVQPALEMIGGFRGVVILHFTG